MHILKLKMFYVSIWRKKLSELYSVLIITIIRISWIENYNGTIFQVDHTQEIVWGNIFLSSLLCAWYWDFVLRAES